MSFPIPFAGNYISQGSCYHRTHYYLYYSSLHPATINNFASNSSHLQPATALHLTLHNQSINTYIHPTLLKSSTNNRQNGCRRFGKFSNPPICFSRRMLTALAVRKSKSHSLPPLNQLRSKGKGPSRRCEARDRVLLCLLEMVQGPRL